MVMTVTAVNSAAKMRIFRVSNRLAKNPVSQALVIIKGTETQAMNSDDFDTVRWN